jgi:hypothetical protein
MRIGENKELAAFRGVTKTTLIAMRRYGVPWYGRGAWPRWDARYLIREGTFAGWRDCNEMRRFRAFAVPLSNRWSQIESSYSACSSRVAGITDPSRAQGQRSLVRLSRFHASRRPHQTVTFQRNIRVWHHGDDLEN